MRLFLPALACSLAFGVSLGACGGDDAAPAGDGDGTARYADGARGEAGNGGERQAGPGAALAGEDRSEAERELAAEMDDELAGAPKPLAALHRQANELLEGGADAFERRLERLRGYPVVVNKWASWCGPCRDEFPYFRRQALERGTEIAFIGVDANDNDGDAAEFLADYPVPYPSYKDPDLKVSGVFNGVAAFPTTAYYDSKGELAYLKQGAYLDEQSFVEDIERHAR